MAVQFAHRHLLDIQSLSRDDIVMVLDLSDRFVEFSSRPIKKVPTLRGRTVITLFMEPSTRTRVSFEIAAKRLSADTINITASSSSTTKGETLLDTVKNLEAMSPEVIIVRHCEAGAAHFVARYCNAAVVNAGDGSHAHPTQALLDCLTLRRKFGQIDGLTVAIVGDIAHSRVARSSMIALQKLGATVRVTGPQTMLPIGLSSMGVQVCKSIQQAVEGVDAVMMLRIQAERVGSQCLFANVREYARTFGLNRTVLNLAAPHAVVMHPGPINRGVELAPDIADGASSVILDQVECGVAVRMAVLYLLAGSPADPLMG